MQVEFGPWDLALVIVVSVQATAIAYIAQPRAKAILATLPLPFTAGVLAVGHPVGPSNVLGLSLIFVFLHQVRWLHHRKSVPIVPAIGLSVLTYSVLGALLVPVLPDTDAAFWVITALVWLLATALLFRMPSRTEVGHRSPLPVYLKLPIVVAIVVVILVSKQLLQGFVTVFPMVTMLAAYEARHSLWTYGRQMPVQVIGMTSMMAAIRLTEASLGIGPSLLVAWAVFLAFYVPISRSRNVG